MREPVPATGSAGGLVSTDQWRLTSLADEFIWVAYAALGSILCLTRFVGLGRGLWLDEVITVEEFVRGGPHAILVGTYLPNNHELFSLLAWATTAVAGESEIALRVWSVVPFLAGVTLVTAWLHVRVSPLSGVLFLFLATGSPLLLDITPTARGYGLAFSAMSIVVVGALEADRSGRSSWLFALFAGGVIGMWTVPNFTIAFFATAAVLLFKPELRRRVLAGSAAAALAVVAWYAPHVGSVFANSGQGYGVEVDLAGLVTSPLDQILLPALLWYDGVVPAAPEVLVPVAVLAIVVMASSPLLGRNLATAVLVSGVLATMLAVWYLQLTIVPRFLSFLLVPLFMLAASGAAAIVGGRGARPPLLRFLLVVAALTALAFSFGHSIVEISRSPREATKDAAELIRAVAPPGTRVYPNMVAPRTLAFYLRERLEPRPAQSDVTVMCTSRTPVVLVSQPFRLEPLRVPCLRRPGVRLFRVEQYARGGAINVWLIPPR